MLSAALVSPGSIADSWGLQRIRGYTLNADEETLQWQCLGARCWYAGGHHSHPRLRLCSGWWSCSQSSSIGWDRPNKWKWRTPIKYQLNKERLKLPSNTSTLPLAIVTLVCFEPTKLLANLVPS